MALLAVKMPIFDRQEEHMRHRCSILLPHARIAVSYETKRLNFRSILLLKMSQYEEDLGRYQECYQHAMQSYEESVEAFGEDSIETQNCKLMLVIALRNTGRDDEAKKLAEELYKECETRELDQKDEATAALNSAIILQRNKEPVLQDLAFALLQKALDRFKACSNNMKAHDCLYHQARILEEQGKIEESESLYRHTLQISREVFGDKHPEVFERMFDVGLIVQKQGKFKQAEQFHRLVLEGRDGIYGTEHPDTMESKQHLAEALREQGHFVEAESLGSQSAKYMQQHLGWHHNKTRLAMSNLTIILYKMGRLREAKALHVLLKFHSGLVPAAFGTNHGSIPFNKDNLSEAEKLLRKALDDAQEKNGDTHPDTIILSERLAECLEMQERRDEIAEICRKFELHE